MCIRDRISEAGMGNELPRVRRDRGVSPRVNSRRARLPPSLAKDGRGGAPRPMGFGLGKRWDEIHLPIMWIPCSRTNTPRENVETPSVFQTWFLETMLGELGRLSCLETRHGAFSSTVRRRILAANISPGGFSAARLWKAPRDGRLTRAPREL